MSKTLVAFLSFVTFVAGVLLGNQYGRRDVVNSRPPQINGETGVPGAISIESSNYRLYSLALYNNEREIIGNVALISSLVGTEGFLSIAKSIAVSGEKSQELDVVLLDDSSNIVRELGKMGASLKSFDFKIDSALSQNQTIALLQDGEKVLQSDKVR